VSCATHATICGFYGDHFKNVGKQSLQQSGKYRVNENDEENFVRPDRARIIAARIVPEDAMRLRPRKNNGQILIAAAPTIERLCQA
jgi:hypothetical protein